LNSLAKLETKNGEKYFQTLSGHTVDALKILRTYIDRNYGVIEQFCERWSLNMKKFLRNLFLAVYLHDIGKLTKQFQENIKQGKWSQKYPHAYYGFYILSDFFQDTIIEVPIELAAILGHHTQLYNGIYSDNNLFEKPEFLEQEIHYFVSSIPEIYKKLGFEKFFNFDINLEIKIPEFSWKKIEKAKNRLQREIDFHPEDNRDWEKVKSVYSFFFAILQTCDDYASANFSEFIENYNGKETVLEDVIENPEKFVPVLQVENIISAVLGEKEPYAFQEKAMNSGKFVTLFAPCGRGKTEAALLWALNALKKYKRNKIIFAMPTQTTSNAMYDRLKNIFGSENVGIFHGRSFIKIREELKNEKEEFDEERDVDEIRDETFKGNIFFKPVTVTTIDHLIFSFVKGFSQADFALGNLQNAVIIFDEIHYYEKLTLEHLLTLFQYLKKMDIPHFLMSGTLPDFMLEKLSDYEHIVDDEGLDFKPFKIEMSENTIFSDEVMEEITKNYMRGLNQFIILNTVERAKDFYKNLREKIPDGNILLYHSQFTFNDRVKKEEEISKCINKKPFILVATQVIEISLDISCDIMYSELAPPDALGQRGGRLNRKGKTWKEEIEHVMKIFLPENSRPYDDLLLEKTMEEIRKYLGPVSYEDIKVFCDGVYVNYQLDIPSNFREFFRNNVIFGEHWTKIATETEEGLIFKVRDEKIQHVDVIPESIFNKEGERALRVENMAKIPLYYLLNDIKKGLGGFYSYEPPKGRKKRIYWICKYPYSYEIGFDYHKEMTIDDFVL